MNKHTGWIAAFAMTLASCSGGTQPNLPVTAAAFDTAQTLQTIAARQNAVTPHASHVTLVIMENRNYSSVIGSASAPYLNKTLIPQGVLMTNSHAIGHPSEPNYLELFSGSNQGVTDDSCPHTFNTPNIGAALIAAGLTFTGYAESMPSVGYTGCLSGSLYARKHNPWVNFPSVPSSDSIPYTGYPSSPASFVWITPNMCNDMHDCSTKTGDTWLSKNLPPIIAANAKDNGLLILTWDEAEPDPGGNPIATVLVGPMIVPGKSSQKITHYTVLHTIETIFGVKCFAKECTSGDITNVWK